jgi:hypothetical protein
MDNDNFDQKPAPEQMTVIAEPYRSPEASLDAILKALTDKLSDIEALVEEVLGKLDDLETPYTTLDNGESED